MPKQTWLYVLPLLLLTWWLGARGLGADAIWWDEWRTVYRAGGAQYGPLSFVGIIERMLAEDPNQSLGYPLLLAGWAQLVGWSDVAARSFSLMVGVPVVAIMYRLGREMASERVGLLAALTLGTSAFYITYLHEMRTYSLFAFFSALAVWAYWHIITVQRMRWYTALALAAAVAGMLYAHYLTAVLIACVGLYHLLFVPKNRLWWQVSGVAVLGGVLFIPWFGVMLQAVNAAIVEGGRPDVALSSREVLDQLVYALTNGFPLVLVVIAGGIGLAIVRPVSAQHRRAAVFVTFTFVTTLAATMLLHEWLTILAHARYLLALWVLFPPLVALSLDAVATRLHGERYLLRAAVGVALISCGWATFAPTFDDYLLPDAYHTFFRTTLRWDAVADTLYDEATATDAVIFSIDRHPWAVQGAIDYYLYGLPARYTPLSQLTDDDDKHAFIAGAPRVWLAQERGESSELGAMQSIIRDEYTHCGDYPVGEGLALDLYARSDMCCTPSGESLVQYEEPFSLAGAAVFPRANTVKVLTQWRVPPDVPVNTYSVALYVMDDANNIYAQVDVPLPHDDPICQLTSIPTADVPPGEYQLKMTVYAWETGRRISGTNADTDEPSDLQTLAPLTMR